MSLSVVSLKVRFCTSRKGEPGEGGWVLTLGPGSMLFLGLAVERPLALGGPFLSFFARMGLEKSSSHVEPPFVAVKLFSHSIGATIGAVSSLDTGCGLSHKCAQDGCNGTCVKLEASKLTLSGKMVHLGDKVPQKRIHPLIG